ncbi:OLC1v1004699C1 [Oldenlandia corymbosa var. corymbosa]|uniref:OLC1v1004699C1 n=1 Tax=Oldenlandia corymbosa var. corymbosa TaxID=529605 RepID=A0AAV1DDN4_OLDCO|nr:OLC1v1004699C1 [Oldenlandia corymbosa var. corymbosa]
MSRPMLLVFLLLILIITSQFEWKQQLGTDVESPNVSQKQQQISKREEAVKEKIILSQEKNIQKLNELVRSLREQLRQCTSSNDSTNGNLNSLGDALIDLDRRPILED